MIDTMEAWQDSEVVTTPSSGPRCAIGYSGPATPWQVKRWSSPSVTTRACARTVPPLSWLIRLQSPAMSARYGDTCATPKRRWLSVCSMTSARTMTLLTG